MVLIRCDPNCLTFMNSWGTDFANKGFFKVKDQNVLNNTTFFDVYWTEDDLTESEKEAFKREGTKRAQEIQETFPSIQELFYECPICHQISMVGGFTGHILEAKCPKCHKKFKPTNKDILRCLYSQTHEN